MADDTQGAIDACTKAIKQIEAYPTTYRFSDWTHCACGHLYRAVEGRYAVNTIEVTELPPETYASVLRTVAGAMGWRNWSRRTGGAAVYVSDRCMVVPAVGDHQRREKAVETLTTVRAVLRQRLIDEQKAAEYEAALAQTPHDHALAV